VEYSPTHPYAWAGISTPGIIAGWIIGVGIYWIRKKLFKNREVTKKGKVLS